MTEKNIPIADIPNDDINRTFTHQQKLMLGRFISLWEYNRCNTFSVSLEHLEKVTGYKKRNCLIVLKKFIELGLIVKEEKASKGFCTKYSVDMDKIKWYASDKPVKEEKPVTDKDLIMNCKSLEDENKRLKKLVACIMDADNQDEINKHINTYLAVESLSKKQFIKKYKD